MGNIRKDKIITSYNRLYNPYIIFSFYIILKTNFAKYSQLVIQIIHNKKIHYYVKFLFISEFFK